MNLVKSGTSKFPNQKIERNQNLNTSRSKLEQELNKLTKKLIIMSLPSNRSIYSKADKRHLINQKNELITKLVGNSTVRPEQEIGKIVLARSASEKFSNQVIKKNQNIGINRSQLEQELSKINKRLLMQLLPSNKILYSKAEHESLNNKKKELLAKLEKIDKTSINRDGVQAEKKTLSSVLNQAKAKAAQSNQVVLGKESLSKKATQSLGK